MKVSVTRDPAINCYIVRLTVDGITHQRVVTDMDLVRNRYALFEIAHNLHVSVDPRAPHWIVTMGTNTVPRASDQRQEPQRESSWSDRYAGLQSRIDTVLAPYTKRLPIYRPK